MNFILEITRRYFWVICALSFLIVSLASYGFIKDLYFYLEDYRLIYSFQAGVPWIRESFAFCSIFALSHIVPWK